MSKWRAAYNVRCCSDTQLAPTTPTVVGAVTEAPTEAQAIVLQFDGSYPSIVAAGADRISTNISMSTVGKPSLILRASFKEGATQLGFLSLVVPSNTALHSRQIQFPLNQVVEFGKEYRLLLYLTVDGTWGGNVASILATGIMGVPAPTSTPTTAAPTDAPTGEPTCVISGCTETPTLEPTIRPSLAPSGTPTPVPSVLPTSWPTPAPTETPTTVPTAHPTASPTSSTSPTHTPTSAPTSEACRDQSPLCTSWGLAGYCNTDPYQYVISLVQEP